MWFKKCYNEAIAFGQPRMVCTALGTSSHAQSISHEMRELYGVHQDSNFI